MNNTIIRDNNISAIAQLYQIILYRGPISNVRVSSAQARGKAKGYAYWGVAGYELKILASGWVGNVATSRAQSSRRSLRLAQIDAENTGLPQFGFIGRLSEQQAEAVLKILRPIYLFMS
jgi:hypothetical protein